MILAEVNRDPKKRRQPFTVEDFMGEEKVQTAEEQMAIMKAVWSQGGGKIKLRKKKD